MRIYPVILIFIAFAITNLAALLYAAVFPQKKIIPDFNMKPIAAKAKEPIQFYDNSNGATTWLWNFGDGRNNKTYQNPDHSYDSAGEYNVTLIINGKESITKKIIISPGRQTVNQITPDIIWPDTSFVYTGDMLDFDDATPGANVWKWDFGIGEKKSGCDTLESKCSFAYKEAGTKLVRVSVYGQDSNGTFYGVASSEIVVRKRIIEKPISPTPKAKPPIADEEWKNALNRNIKNKANDDWTMPYMKDSDTPVNIIYNKNNNKNKRWIEFYKDIKNTSSIISKAKLQWDDSNKYIIHIKVWY